MDRFTQGLKQILAAVGGLLLWGVAFWLPAAGLYLLGESDTRWYGVMSILAGLSIGVHLLDNQDK